MARQVKRTIFTIYVCIPYVCVCVIEMIVHHEPFYMECTDGLTTLNITHRIEQYLKNIQRGIIIPVIHNSITSSISRNIA